MFSIVWAKRISIAVLWVFMIKPSALFASSDYFICNISGFQSIKEGVIKPYTELRGRPVTLFNGKPIHIDRRTGEVSGPRDLNIKKNEFNVSVLDYGSSGDSFKALATSKISLSVSVYYIEVINYEGLKKSFIIYHNGAIWHGICE